MVLDPHEAAQFIDGYKALLLAIDAQVSGRDSRRVLEKLVAARERLSKDRSLLKEALARVKKKKPGISPDVIRAVEGLQIEKWIYLRDTTRYSVFIHPKERAAFGVVGLTDRIRDVVGCSGVIMETGLARYRGRFVCDGLAAGAVLLGPNYRKSFADLYRALKSEGSFHVAYED